MHKELNEYLRNFLSINDPIIYSLLIILLFLTILFIFYKYIYFPAQKKYLIEKKEIEIRGIKLMALFAELAPDPVIRTNENGIIIHLNEAAKIIDPVHDIFGKDIKEYLTSLSGDVSQLIKQDRSFSLPFHTGDKYYEVIFKSVPNLNIAQLYFRDLTERKLFEKELDESRKQLLYLSRHIQESIEEERKRISREIHDSVGQNLVFIQLLLQNTIFEQKNNETIQKVLEALDLTLREAKRISGQLKPSVLDNVDLPTAIKTLTGTLSIENHIKGDVNIIGKIERLDIKIETSLYRIIQEALTNIIKHSKAKHFNISLIYNAEFVRIAVSDDGIGISSFPDPKYHFGLSNMKERVENLNGTFEIETSEKIGTILSLTIPRNNHS